MFKLGDLEFDVRSAVLTGAFADGAMNKRMGYKKVPSFLWHIEVETSEGKLIFTDEDSGEEDYEMIAPNLYHNNGFSLDVRSWKSIDGLTKKWDASQNEKGEEAGTLYVFGHEEVTSGKIEFIKRMGNIFYMRWSGTANVFWDAIYGEDVPFTFEGEVTFSGISAHCDEICCLEELEPAINEFVDLSEYDFVSEKSHEISTGISFCWYFSPKS